MELIPPWPVSMGNWLAFLSAGVAALAGLCMLLSPVLHRSHPPAGIFPQLSAGLAGGFCLGLGLSAILLDQPLVYLALGAAWALAALSGLVGILCGAGKGRWQWGLLLGGVSLAAMPLAYVFGHVA